MMTRYSTLEDLTPRQRVAYGSLFAAMGVLFAWIVQRHPEGLRAPMWVVMCACASFSIAGVSIAVHPFVPAAVYRWLMVLLLAVMGAIPLWIGFGSGRRDGCRSNVAVLASPGSCRVAFGIAGVVMVLMFGVAVVHALRGTNADG